MRRFLINLKVNLLGYLGSLILALISLTLRWRKVVLQFEPEPALTHRPRLFVLWHNRQLFAPYVYNHLLPAPMRLQLYALVSAHSDGRLIAKALELNGMKNIPGSSSHGGRKALLGLIRLLRKEKAVAVTPDGPRGPIYKLKPGVLKLAQATGFPIYSFAYGARSYWSFGSWDKMILPKPFSPAVAIFSGPFKIPERASNEELESLALKLEAELTRITTLADNYEYA